MPSRLRILFFGFILFSCKAFAQPSKLITGEFTSASFDAFVKEVEEKTPYCFYYDSLVLDSFRVNIQAEALSITEVLTKVFENTSFHYFIDASGNIFITKTTVIHSQLPADFFDRAKQQPDTLQIANTQTIPNDATEKIRSSIENRLYEIGMKTLPPKSRVTLAGYIRDVRNGEAIAGASVFIDSLSANAMTDGFGYYSITLPPGRHILYINSAGMKATSRQVLLHGDGQLNIELKEYIPSLKEVVVTSSRTSNTRSLQMGFSKLTIKNIKQVPVVFGEADVLKVVLTLPGVTSVGEGSAGFNVRGGSADQNLILLNDVTIYNPTHLFGFFSAFNPDVIKGVELYKSSIPEKYGGRLSSVLDVTAKDGNTKKFSGTGGIGLLTSKLVLEGPLAKDRSSFIVSGRTSYSNWLLKKIPNSSFTKSKASFYDLNFHLNHTLNSNNNLYINGYISNDQFQLNNDTSYQYGNKNFNVKWKHIFSNKLYGVFTAGYDHYKYDVKSESNTTNAYQMAFDINQANFRSDFTYALNLKHLFKFGLTSVYFKLHPGSLLPVGRQSLVLPDVLQPEQGLETALYFGDEYTISPDLSLNAGFRLSAYNYLGPRNQFVYVEGVPRSTSTLIDTIHFGNSKMIKTYVNPEFRIAMRYSLSEHTSVKLGFNTLRQYIHMLSNTNAISPTDVWKLSDAYIKPQSGLQFSAGFYQNFQSNTIETSVEVYYKKMKNFLDYKSGASLLLNHHIETDVISSEGKAYGAELLVKKTSGKLNGWMSYTYSRTLLRSNDAQAGELVNKGAWYPANYDKPHNANFAGNYKFSHRYSISLGVNYSTGRPITLPLAIFNMGGAQRVFYSERNGYRIPDYFRTDISFLIEGNHKVKQRTHNSWSFGVYNVTGRKNAYSVYFIEENGYVKGYQLSIFGTIIPFVTYNFRF